MAIDEIMKLSGYDLDIVIAERLFGTRIMSQEEMRSMAELIWKDQPHCCNFIAGFYATGDGETTAELHANAVFRQQIPQYSTDHNDAAKVREFMADPKRNLWTRFISLLSLHWTGTIYLLNATPQQQCRAALLAYTERRAV